MMRMEKTILIIESDISELRKLREILSREGFNIMTATNRKMAEYICERIPINYILSDSSGLNLKGMEGRETE